MSCDLKLGEGELERFFKRGVFGDSLHRIRVDGRPNRRKKSPFSTKADTC